jgi:hypothetical protein
MSQVRYVVTGIHSSSYSIHEVSAHGHGPSGRQGSLKMCQEKHGSRIGYSHDHVSVDEIVVQFPLCQELSCFQLISGERVGVLAK